MWLASDISKRNAGSTRTAFPAECRSAATIKLAERDRAFTSFEVRRSPLVDRLVAGRAGVLTSSLTGMLRCCALPERVSQFVGIKPLTYRPKAPSNAGRNSKKLPGSRLTDSVFRFLVGQHVQGDLLGFGPG